MILQMEKSGNADRVLIGWVFVWSIVLSLTTLYLTREPPSQFMLEMDVAFQGLVVGGLMSTWVTAGTWAFLIDLPRSDETTGGVNGQRLLDRIVVVFILLLKWMITFPVVPEHS